jgi:3'-phosphoadenosine 5'-phosphosulfate sulfotransferase (PAPS reductase)/FAD synthetase
MNPFLITEPTVISFSGGRTSAYLLHRVLEANNGLPDDALVVFANTGKEEEATLEFVRDCEVNWGCEIHWLEFQIEDPKFRRVNFDTASRNGEPFEALIRQRKYLPNPVTRFCTAELKIRVIHRYVKSLGWDHHNETMDWVGIRADEMRRAVKMDRSRTPLVTAGVTAKDVGEFWAKNSFDLKLPNMNGKTMHGNCDLCFLKGGNQVLSLIQEKPERAVWWSRMEEQIQTFGGTKGDGDRFRMDRPSYAQMANFAKNQQNLFSDETIPCYCGD